jgi:hypothetical protein
VRDGDVDDDGRPSLALWAIGSVILIALVLLIALFERGDGAVLAYTLSGLLLLPVGICVVAAVVAALATAVARRRRRRERSRTAAGLCVKCNYDLRGREGERCPECGALVWRSRDPRTGQVIAAPKRELNPQDR